MKTPLDIGSNKDTSFIYVLLPKSWDFSDTPISLKIPAKKWKHPFYNIPITSLTSKTAIMHRNGLYLKKGQNCNYEFNLHVTISQKVDGRMMRTPIIIDPGSDNDSGGSPTSGN